LVRQAFLQADGLPFDDVLSEGDIQQAFEAENACFARDEGDLYTPAVTLWAFLSQALHAQRLRSCAAAVSRVIVLCVALGRQPPSPDTGAYCRARAKLPEAVLTRLVYETAEQLESRVPADWLWLGRHVKAGDGTTLITPDTPENQAAWPQPRTQKPGLGFPILRMVVLFSLATAAMSAVAVGPYQGKGTGEPALLRELLDRFQPGDVFLGDCYFCSYFLLALLVAYGVDVVTRQHQRRSTDFRLGRRLGREDHVVPWQRPQRPSWMDQETYATIPETLEVRELKVRVAIRGFRVQQLVVVTTLTDAQRYPASEVAGLFRQRWHAELDLRNIKISLQMDDLRGQTPEIVRREIRVHWLAYNLIRKTIAQAVAASHRWSSSPSLRLAKEILLVVTSACGIPRLPNSLPVGRRSRCAPANVPCQHLTETSLLPLIILAVSASCSALDPSARVNLSSQPLSRVTLKVVDSAIHVSPLIISSTIAANSLVCI